MPYVFVFHRNLVCVDSISACKVETPYHDNDLILTPIISPQCG